MKYECAYCGSNHCYVKRVKDVGKKKPTLQVGIACCDCSGEDHMSISHEAFMTGITFLSDNPSMGPIWYEVLKRPTAVATKMDNDGSVTMRAIPQNKKTLQ